MLVLCDINDPYNTFVWHKRLIATQLMGVPIISWPMFYNCIILNDN